MKDVFEYLNSNDSEYSHGVFLFSKLSPNKRLLRSLLRGESDYTKEKLRYELKKILNNSDYEKKQIQPEKNTRNNGTPSVSTSKRSHGSNKKPIHGNVHHQFNLDGYQPNTDFNTVIDQLKEDAILLLKSRAYHHSKLFFSNKATRKKLAFKIIEITETIDEKYDQIGFIQEHQKLPTKLVMQMMSAEQYKRFKQVDSYINRYKRLIAAPKSPDKISFYKQKLKQYETEKKEMLHE